jgi:hypothetical protein
MAADVQQSGNFASSVPRVTDIGFEQGDSELAGGSHHLLNGRLRHHPAADRAEAIIHNFEAAKYASRRKKLHTHRQTAATQALFSSLLESSDLDLQSPILGRSQLAISAIA